MESTILNKLEIAIIEDIAKEYPSIKSHIPRLQVESRENTGVGMYVNLNYNHLDESLIRLKDGTLSTNEIIVIDSLENGLGFVLDVSNGLINFIELFTYGDEFWDGEFSSFKFEKT